MRLTISSLLSSIAGAFTSGSDKWGGQELEDTMINVVDTFKNVYTTLTDGPTVTWDRSVADIVFVEIAGNRTLSITNAGVPCTGIIYVKQGTGGSRTLSLPAGSKTPSGWALSTAVGSVDVLGFIYDGTNYRWSMEKYSS